MRKITASLLALAWSAAEFTQSQDKNLPDSVSIAIHPKDESLAYHNEFEIPKRHFFINAHRLDNTYMIFRVQLLDTCIKGILMASYHHSNNC